MFLELLRDGNSHKAGERLDMAEADADPLTEAVHKSTAEAMSRITGSISTAAVKEFAAAALALGESAHLGGLLVLRLPDNPINASAAAALKASPLGRRLAVLEL
jgi:hypothetical protein